MASTRTDRTLKGALAGAVAAGVWAAQQPLDKKVFGCEYDDVELLGKAVTRGDDWRLPGTVMHLGNGALFGAVYANAAPLVPIPAWAKGPAAGMLENFALWPLGRLTDRFHPRRNELPTLGGNRRALLQATWRHMLFAVVLNELERRLNPPEPEPEPALDVVMSSNGHGSLDEVPAASGTS